MIRLRWKDKWIDFESVEWSGTDTQCSRQLLFTVPSNPYDKDFENHLINLGDIVYLYDGKEQLFLGTVTTREKSTEIGVMTYIAMDFMQHLLRSNGTYVFKNKTPETITKKVCSDIEVETKDLAETKFTVRRAIYDDMPIYDIIISAYRKARVKTEKNYMPLMIGSKVSVQEKGRNSNVKLEQGVNLLNCSYTDTTDDIVNRITIYSDKRKKLGKIESLESILNFGVYQKTYTKEEDVDAKAEAKSMLQGITQEVSVEALGDTKAISGRSIRIDCKAAGVNGTYYITSDTHTFAGGKYTMTLELSKKNLMESGREEKEEQKKEITNASTCYYLEGAVTYHSTKYCVSCKGKSTYKSTVKEMKKILITRGKNKGKRRYKPCSKCWRM